MIWRLFIFEIVLVAVLALCFSIVFINLTSLDNRIDAMIHSLNESSKRIEINTSNLEDSINRLHEKVSDDIAKLKNDVIDIDEFVRRLKETDENMHNGE